MIEIVIRVRISLFRGDRSFTEHVRTEVNGPTCVPELQGSKLNRGVDCSENRGNKGQKSAIKLSVVLN